ncbi:MAG TPA: hypothetical protein VHT53_04125 [Candidatus Elarobacter sp.]|jgi:hypothetical protein|nr:hypothetical protein [Candidatus Elarobacter sp.]
MGAQRAERVVALQSALLRAAGAFGGAPEFEAVRPRVLATAAALDYVLMLARGAAGVRIPERDAERAMREGITRGVDDLIAAATVIARLDVPGAAPFARETAQSLLHVLREEELEGDDRRFAVIALANA